ncbi:MAG: PilC/PilY family type IV pilus protein [Steroidobacteraceae bacterium]|jgi:type IV pilus assembly protein PilY1|nr:PilC/PilY family type IV pilus protein [Steroidobacteraceae bacterium]
MSRAQPLWPPRSLALLALLALPAAASMDEAWVARAALPEGVRPLLVLLDHASGDPSQTVNVLPAYDPAVDYAARVADGPACDPARIYWRRGPGPAPDCATGPSVSLEAAARVGLRCAAARPALEAHGVYVASRAAQWQDAPGGGGWRELQAASEAAVECRADRGLHGAAAGTWFAASGAAGPWSADARAETDWDASPLSDAYVFFSGNYLNYLDTASRSVNTPLPQAFAAAAVLAATVTEGLDLAIARPADEPGRMDFILPPAALPASHLVADALAGPSDARHSDVASSVTALAEWLSRDGRAFTHACRAATSALVTATAGEDCADGACLGAALSTLDSYDLVATLPDTQRSRTWVLGPSPAATALAGAAHASGTGQLDLGDPLAMVMLFAHALQRDAGRPAESRVSSPALPVTGHGLHARDMFFGVSRPEAFRRWSGSLRRTSLDAAGGPPLFDAADELAAPIQRVVRSDLLTADLMSRDGALESALAARDAGSLGLSRHDTATAADLAAWTRGVDNFDEDADGDREEPRRPLGDPGLDPPLVIRYTGDPPRTLVFTATGDGLVHAFDADDGSEDWAFLPAANHGSLRALADPAETRVRLPRGSGLRLERLDSNGDGLIDASAGDRARLLLGLGAGARGYVALDVSDPSRPRVAWSIDETLLPDLGETFTPPLPARMRIDALRQRGDWRVAIVTGGYDPLQRTRGAAADRVGGRLAIVSAATGALLWQAASAEAPGVTLVHPELTASFAAAPRAVDADGDGLAERLYALDVSGRLWRFDFEGDAPTVRLMARLGLSGRPEDSANARRFHATPDVVYLREGASPRLALAFGSGWAERPRDTVIADRFHVIFDSLGSDEAGDPTPLGDDDLADVTAGAAPAAGAAGWFLRLDAHGPGEKTWGASLTLGHRLRFTTWQPLAADPDAPCGPPRGTGRLYSLSVATGQPLEFVDDAPAPSVDLPGDAPPPPLRLVLPLSSGPGCALPPCRGEPLLVTGEHAWPAGFGNDPVKTSWRRLETAE